jgi:hypothetical protein
MNQSPTLLNTKPCSMMRTPKTSMIRSWFDDGKSTEEEKRKVKDGILIMLTYIHLLTVC